MAKEIAELHFTGEVGQKVFLEKDGKVLMCRALNTDLWDFPGGRLHKGEDPKTGLLREVKEEIGVDVSIGKPLYVSVLQENEERPGRYFIVFEAGFLEPIENIKAAEDEIEELRWCTPGEIKELNTPPAWKETVDLYFSN